MKVAAAIAAALTPPQTATATDRTVSLGGGATFTAADSPLRIAGAAPGGTITGIAFVGDTMYAVTDAGGLFRVNNPTVAAECPRPVHRQFCPGPRRVSASAALVRGPDATEDGRYANMLFAMDTEWHPLRV